MKTSLKILIISIITIASSLNASAQYYELVNRATDMIATAIRGGQSYRGFVDAEYLNGLGSKKASFVGISTTQGMKYGNLFFMGIGAGIDYLYTDVNDGSYRPANINGKTNAWMVPLFTDFRLNFGQPAGTGFFIDLKVGAGFYIANKYILVGDGYINSSESFLLRPSIGVRVPVSKTNSKYAINFSATYQLLTNSYWYNPNQNNSCTLNSLGVSASFEW